MDKVLWVPSQHRIEKAVLTSFKAGYESFLNKKFKSYTELHESSVEDAEKFWNFVFDFFNVDYVGNLNPAFKDLTFNEYTWYQNIKMNFAENLLKKGKDESTALNFIHESGEHKKVTYKELRTEVNQFANFLANYIQVGDVVGAFMPNIPETTVTMLATSKVGGTFTSTSSDFGVEGVYDRFSQSRPKVVVAAIGYEYFGKYFDLTEKLIELESRLSSMEILVIVDFLNRGVDLSKFKKAKIFSTCLSDNSPRDFVKLPFNHPQYIMYSSGTTGRPKCIVHSQGGTLLQHIKELGLHSDLTEVKKIFFFTTCGWMMWNWLMSSLYFGSEIVLYEGSPAHLLF